MARKKGKKPGGPSEDPKPSPAPNPTAQPVTVEPEVPQRVEDVHVPTVDASPSAKITVSDKSAAVEAKGTTAPVTEEPAGAKPSPCTEVTVEAAVVDAATTETDSPVPVQSIVAEPSPALSTVTDTIPATSPVATEAPAAEIVESTVEPSTETKVYENKDSESSQTTDTTEATAGETHLVEASIGSETIKEQTEVATTTNTTDDEIRVKENKVVEAEEATSNVDKAVEAETNSTEADADEDQRMSLKAVPLFVANEILKEQVVIEEDDETFTEVKRKDKRKKNKKEEAKAQKKNGQAQHQPGKLQQLTPHDPEAAVTAANDKTEETQVVQTDSKNDNSAPAENPIALTAETPAAAALTELEATVAKEANVELAADSQGNEKEQKLAEKPEVALDSAHEKSPDVDKAASAGKDEQVSQESPFEVPSGQAASVVLPSKEAAILKETEEVSPAAEAQAKQEEVSNDILGCAKLEPAVESPTESAASEQEQAAEEPAPVEAITEQETTKAEKLVPAIPETLASNEKQSEKGQKNKKDKQQKKANKPAPAQTEKPKAAEKSEKVDEQKSEESLPNDLVVPDEKPKEEDIVAQAAPKEEDTVAQEAPKEELLQVEESVPKEQTVKAEDHKQLPKQKKTEEAKKTGKPSTTQSKKQPKKEAKQEADIKQKKQQKNTQKQASPLPQAKTEQKQEEPAPQPAEIAPEERKPKTISVSEDDEGVFEVRPVFLPNTCHVCKEQHTGKTILKSCAACRMVAYCSAEHQKEHWPEHKLICKFLRKELEKQKKRHVYESARGSDYGTWKRTRYTTMMQCEDSIKRPLQPYEREMFLFPRHCGTCYETDGEKLHQCKSCSSAFFCSPQHKKKDHDRWCAELKLLFDLTVQQAKTGRIEPPFPDKVFQQYEVLPGSMKEFLVTRMLGPGGAMAYGNVSFACLTETASYPLTLLYALQKLEEPKPELEKAAAEERGRALFTMKPINELKSMVIHVVGAELAFECDSIIKWDVFFVHLLPNLQHLRVVFVGPELVSGSGTIPNGICDEDLRCPHCVSADRKIEYDFQPGLLYQDYADSEQYTKPNVIVAYNCGLYRETGFSGTDTWGPCINAMTADPSIPVILTAYTSAEAPKDTARVQRTVSSEVLLTPQKNPYRSLKPCRNFVDEESAPVMYKNNYFSVVHGV